MTPSTPSPSGRLDDHGCPYCKTCGQPRCCHEDESRILLDMTYGFHPFEASP
jgi:hypothetical protein